MTFVQQEWLCETTRCFDCGVDTEIEGYVNRVPTDKGWIDGFICGPCTDTFDSASDNGDDPWDALDAYLPSRIVAVDKSDTKATDFRRWFEYEDERVANNKQTKSN